MSPRRPHLRNRKRIKAPRRFEDAEFVTSSPQQEFEASDESSELEEEIYKSPKPKKPKSKTRECRGEVTEFNPNLPPAAFPTLDHPDYVHNGGNIVIDLESHLSRLPSQESEPAESEAINPGSLGRACHGEAINLVGDHPTMTSAPPDFTRRESQNVMKTSITGQKRPRASMPSSIYGEPTDNGPRNPIWVNNMARMEEAGRMSDLDRNMLDMESSDEEYGAAEMASTPKTPAWDDLTVAHKLDLADTIAELCTDPPDPAQVMHQLRLSLSEEKELIELLVQRQDRPAREKADQQKLQEQVNDILLHDGRLSQLEFHQMVEENLYGTINETDPLQTNPMELKKAKEYLRYCGFDPALADSNWDVPFISNAASGTDPGSTQRKRKWGLSNTAPQTLHSSPEGPFSRQPALFARSQQASNPPDPRLAQVQKHTREALPRHRPIPAHALIAQHSPAAPLSKVPVQSYRVALRNQSGDLRARYPGTVPTPQPTLPASPVQPNAAKGPDLLAVKKAPLKARGTSSILSTPQEEHSSPVGSHSLVPKGLPTARRNPTRQCSGSPKVRASALQETGRVMDKGDSVNRKKRKKGAV